MNEPSSPSTFPPDLGDASSPGVRGEAVSLHARLPMDWTDTITPESALGDVMADNLTLLRALLMLDEPAASHESDQGRPDPIHNLERRIDLLLLMASTALRGMGTLPTERPCALASRKLCWASDRSIGVGRRLWARLYLRHRVALPLILPGRIAEEHFDRGQFWHTLDIDALDQPVQNDLDRLIFRHHRRQVARQRKGH